MTQNTTPAEQTPQAPAKSLTDLQREFDHLNAVLRQATAARNYLYQVAVGELPPPSFTIHAPRGLDISVDMATLSDTELPAVLSVLLDNAERNAVAAWTGANAVCQEATRLLSQAAAAPKAPPPNLQAERALDAELQGMLAAERGQTQAP